MRKLGLVVVVAALLPIPMNAAQRSVDLAVAFIPARAPLGTPFGLRVTITNGGTTTIQVPTARHLVMAMQWDLPPGAGALPPRGGPASTAVATTEPLAPGQSKPYELYPPESTAYLPRLCKAGKYQFKLVVDMKPGLSEGAALSAVSAEADVEVVEPTGEDRAAYEYLLSPLSNAPPEPCPAECTFSTGLAAGLLQKFPASTYAAYVVRDLTVSKGLAQVDPARLATLLGGGLRAVARSIPCPPGAGCDANLRPDGQNRPEQAIDWSARWIDIVLKAHPDVWFADELRLRLALDEIAAGRSSLGASDLENLSKTAHPDIADKAGKLLALVKEDGSIK